MSKKVKNIVDLRENLLDELHLFYDSPKNDNNLDRLNSISKVSSAVIRTAKLQLEYAKHKGVDCEIEFISPKKENANN
jgi:REP element-mobilizing transposase RayT